MGYGSSMRNAIQILVGLGLLVSVAIAVADDVVLRDGTVVTGRVESIQVEGRDAIPRAQLAGVRLDGDRATIDSVWIERLLRFALERTRRGVAADGKIGVFVDRGVHPPSAMAVIRRLDEAKRAPRLLFESDMTDAGLDGLDIVVVPGGWAPSQLVAMKADGQAALARFVAGGGGYLGICAGGYLVCEDVVWEGAAWPYPIRLAPGTATGPIDGLAPWPQSEVFTLDLPKNRDARAIYAGGSSFDVKGAEVLAHYPNGSAAAIAFAHGKGQLVLTGAHIEYRESSDADLLAQDGWATDLKPGESALFNTFLDRLLARQK